MDEMEVYENRVDKQTTICLLIENELSSQKRATRLLHVSCDSNGVFCCCPLKRSIRSKLIGLIMRLTQILCKYKPEFMGYMPKIRGHAYVG